MAGYRPRGRRVAAADAAHRSRNSRSQRLRSRSRCPVPGDVRGLAAGTQFQRDAVTAGEAIIVNGGPPSQVVGLVPDFEYDDADAY